MPKADRVLSTQRRSAPSDASLFCRASTIPASHDAFQAACGEISGAVAPLGSPQACGNSTLSLKIRRAHLTAAPSQGRKRNGERAQRKP
jgi:hypothetical protein